MMTYKDSTLWKEAYNDKYGHHVLRERLTNAFEITHNNASFLLDKIRIDFPSLTIHDITHVDSLWQVASVIAGDDYQLNPLEGFIHKHPIKYTNNNGCNSYSWICSLCYIQSLLFPFVW